MKITELSEFLEIKEQYDAETELVKQLEKKPLSNAQVIDMLTRGLDNEQSAKQLRKFKNLLNDLRSRGLIVEDRPQSFKEFEEANVGYICIRYSDYSQMTIAELRRFKDSLKDANSMFSNSKAKGYKIYMNLPMDEHGQGMKDYVRHFLFKGKSSGTGWNVQINHLGQNISGDDEKAYNTAGRIYADARKRIRAIFAELELDTDANFSEDAIKFRPDSRPVNNPFR